MKAEKMNLAIWPHDPAITSKKNKLEVIFPQRTNFARGEII